MDLESRATGPEAKRPWFDPATAILMGIVSLSTAWCSFQSSRWNAEGNEFASHAGKIDRQIIAQHLEARQIEAMHMRLWMEVVDAHLDGDTKLERFYTDRFSEELKPAYEKWIALNPYENSAAPASPFVSGLYSFRYEKEIRDAHRVAAESSAQAKIADHNASGYLSNTVILAMVLFFAGTAGRFDRRRVRLASLAFAVALFLYTAVRMILLPVL